MEIVSASKLLQRPVSSDSDKTQISKPEIESKTRAVQPQQDAAVVSISQPVSAQAPLLDPSKLSALPQLKREAPKSAVVEQRNDKGDLISREVKSVILEGSGKKGRAIALKTEFLRNEQGQELGRVSSKTVKDSEGKVLRSIDTVRRQDLDDAGNKIGATQLSVIRDSKGKVVESRELQIRAARESESVSVSHIVQTKRNDAGEIVKIKERKLTQAAAQSESSDRVAPDLALPIPQSPLPTKRRGPILTEAKALKGLSLKV